MGNDYPVGSYNNPKTKASSPMENVNSIDDVYRVTLADSFKGDGEFGYKFQILVVM